MVGFNEVLQQAVQASQAAQQAVADANVHRQSSRLDSIVDPKVLQNIKPFSGKDEDFPEWEVKLKSMAKLLDIKDSMDQAVSSAHDIALSAVADQRDKKVYKPDVAPRLNAMLMGLLSPKFTNDKSFTEQIVEWKRNIEEYTRASGKSFDDSMKVAVLVQHAPSKMRSVVLGASARAGSDYHKFERELYDFEVGGRTYSGLGLLSSSSVPDPVPMEVGALQRVTCQFCGKPGHSASDCWKLKGGKKGEKGAGKGRQEKGGKSQQQQSQQNSSNGGSTGSFKGKCNFCGKVGHKGRECRKKQADAAAGGRRSVGAIELQEADGSEAKTVGMVAVESTLDQGKKLVPVCIGIDSGCEQHCGPTTVLTQVAVRKSMKPPPLRTASGADLEVEGVYVLDYMVTAPSGRVLKFTADVMLFSVGVLEDNGFTTCLSSGCPMLSVDYDRDGVVEVVPLRKQGRSYYMDVLAEIASPRMVAPLEAPAAEGDTAVAVLPGAAADPQHEVVPFLEVEVGPVPEAMPALIPVDAPVALMRDRLRALGEPI
eukprot:4900308-Amphidinium_carterae.1